MTVNGEVKAEMARRGMTQSDLAEVLGMNQPDVSIMLKRELSAEEQLKIIVAIKEASNER